MKEPKKARSSFGFGNTNSTTRKFSNKEEKSIQRTVGGMRQPNSGATPFMKGDIITGEYMLDAKSTESRQIIVDERMLQKLESDAMTVAKKPGLVLTFPKCQIRNKKWLLIPL